MRSINPVDPEKHDAVHAQLQRMLAHPIFSNSKRLSSLLRHVVEQTLASRADELKEYTLGLEVFGRGSRFDPRLDSIVRVEASKLRSRLTTYYKDPGSGDPIEIQLPRGSYVPVITCREPLPAQHRAPGSIAVLPFLNLSLDEDGEYFADGITEEVINRLGSVAGLRVVSRTSAFQFKGKTGDIQDIGARLRADYLMEGSVRKSGEQLRVTAQLIEVRSGYQLWSQAWDETLAEVFAIQKAIASAICVALGQALTIQPTIVNGEGKPASMDAYRAYLRARFHRNQWTPEGYSRSIEHYQKALEHEPDYVQALAGLSEAYTLRTIIGDVAPGPYLELARVAAMRALALRQSSPQAHLSLAWIYYVYDWKWEQGDAEIRHALAAEPSFAEAYHLRGILLGVRGRHREAAQSMSTALQLDPLSLVINTHKALITYFSCDFTTAEHQIQSALLLDPNFVEAHWILAWIYERQGRYGQALGKLQTVVQLSTELPLILTDKICVYALMGDAARARELLGQLVGACSSLGAAATGIAKAYFLLGDYTESAAWLERAFKERDILLPWICGDPRYEGLWTLPALQSFRQRFIASAAVSG